MEGQDGRRSAVYSRARTDSSGPTSHRNWRSLYVPERSWVQGSSPYQAMPLWKVYWILRSKPIKIMSYFLTVHIFVNNLGFLTNHCRYSIRVEVLELFLDIFRHLSFSLFSHFTSNCWNDHIIDSAKWDITTRKATVAHTLGSFEHLDVANFPCCLPTFQGLVHYSESSELLISSVNR